MANIFNYDGSSLLSNQNLAKTQGKNGPMGFIMFLIIHRTGSWTNSPPKKKPRRPCGICQDRLPGGVETE